jgi:hypothetical protein
MKIRFAAGIALIAALLAPLAAQEPPPLLQPPQASQPPGGRKTPAPIPLKVTVVLSRYQGEKRISSMPYVLGVMASGWGAGPKTTLRMGVEVPVTTTTFAGDGKTTPVSSYNYRGVGTNIDCGATFDEAVPGLFQLAVTVSDSSLGLDVPKGGAVAPNVPSFRNFNSAFTALLRDGQTMQYTSATDPVTGEVMKIDITAAVMK